MNLGSSEKRVCLPVSANRNTNESADLYWGSRLKANTQDRQQKLSCVMCFSFFLFSSLCLASCLPLFHYTCGRVHFMGKTWILLPIKTIFLWDYFSHHHLTDGAVHCTVLFLTYHFISLSFHFAPCCIIHVSTQLFVIIFKNNHVCLPFVQITNSWNRRIFSNLFKWGRTSCRLVNWCNKMIRWPTASSWHSEASDVIILSQSTHVT